MNVGISACLLGQPVRYDGGHKLDHYLVDTLGKFVAWLPVCPEVEIGLAVPREPLHLQQYNNEVRLVTVKSGIDYTDKMLEWAGPRLDHLANERIRGFVFKAKSPSSGMAGIKVYSDAGAMPRRTGVGIFAGALMARFPDLPVIDEGRLHDDTLRENFIESLFAYDRWCTYTENDGSQAGLIDFHTRHKLLLMAHSPTGLRGLGKVVADHDSAHQEKLKRYGSLLSACLAQIATVKKNVNVLQHMMGYFKRQLGPDDKRELLGTIEAYHGGLVPLIVPITLLKHYVRIFNEPYLAAQYYLDPNPAELMLRNHV